MEGSKKIFVVGGGSLPLWKRLVSGVLYTILLYYVYEDLMHLWDDPSFETLLFVLMLLLNHVGHILPVTLFFSVVVTKQLDLGEDRLTTLYSIGRFSKAVHTDIPNLEYVSVFLKEPGLAYEVNIWYLHRGHRRFGMGFFDTKDEAMAHAEVLAEALDLDILDATVRGNSVWVEREREE